MHSYKHCKEIKNSAVFAVRVDLPPLWMSLDNTEIIQKDLQRFRFRTPQAFSHFFDDIIKHKQTSDALIFINI